MTAAEILAAVAAKFPKATPATQLSWVNSIGALIWSLEQWTFRQTSLDVTYPSNDPVVDITPPGGAAVGRVIVLTIGADELPLEELPIDEWTWLYADSTARGRPCHYTKVADVLKAGPRGDTTYTGKLVYDSRWVALTGTENETQGMLGLLPVAYHRPVLVNGALALGQAEHNDPTSSLNDAVLVKALDGMRAEYLDRPTVVRPVYGA